MINFADYQIEIEGVTCAVPCLSITLYSDSVIDENNTDMALLSPWYSIINEFRDLLNWCYSDFEQYKAVKADSKNIGLFEAWLSNAQGRAKDNFFTTLWSGQTRDEWIPPGVNVSYRHNDIPQKPLSILEIQLPLSWLDSRTVDDIKKYVKGLVKNYPLLSGHVGLSFIYNYYSTSLIDMFDDYFHQWLMRHPGLMQPGPNAFLLVADKTLPDIGWMTFLGEKYTNYIGGVEVLQKNSNLIRK